MIQVGFRSNLLNVVRLGILDIDHILSSVLKPADQHKITKGPGLRWWFSLSAFCSRLSRFRNCRWNVGPWVGSRSDFLVRILIDYSLLPFRVGRTVAAIDVRSIGPGIHGLGVACVDDDDNRAMVGGGSEGFRLHRRG